MALENNRGIRRPHSIVSEENAENRSSQDNEASKVSGNEKSYDGRDGRGDSNRQSQLDKVSTDRANLSKRKPRRPRSLEETSRYSVKASVSEKSPKLTISEANKVSSNKNGSTKRNVPSDAERRTVLRKNAVKAEAPVNSYGVRRVNGVSVSEEELDEERRLRKLKSKRRRNRILIMILVELVTLVLIVCVSHIMRYMNLTQDIEFDVAKVKNPNIDIQKQKTMEGYWTVVVFGVDARDGNVGRGANADVQIVANIDMGTGDIKLMSVYRDTYLNLGNGSRYAKINEAYAAGGPEQAVSALNKNLDLDIENYVTFNWKAVADAVSMVGGVDVDITEKEFYYMNAFIHETCVKSGINEKNPAAEYINQAGMQHLDGVQTVAYARLRYMDDDFQRTRRQREVIEQVLEKCKHTNLATLTQIIDTVFPQVATNVDMGDVIQLARGIARYDILDTQGFPKDLKTQMMGKKGDCVIPDTLSSNVIWMHEYLFEDKDYDPTDAVWGYSEKIAEDSAYYRNNGGKGDGGSSGSGKKTKETKSKYESETYHTKAATKESSTEERKRNNDDYNETYNETSREKSETSGSTSGSTSSSEKAEKSSSYQEDNNDNVKASNREEDENREESRNESRNESTRSQGNERERTEEDDDNRGEGESSTTSSSSTSSTTKSVDSETDRDGNYRDSDGYIIPTNADGAPDYGDNGNLGENNNEGPASPGGGNSQNETTRSSDDYSSGPSSQTAAETERVVETKAFTEEAVSPGGGGSANGEGEAAPAPAAQEAVVEAADSPGGEVVNMEVEFNGPGA